MFANDNSSTHLCSHLTLLDCLQSTFAGISIARYFELGGQMVLLAKHGRTLRLLD